MNANYKPIRPLLGAAAEDPLSDDQKYWACMKETAVLKEPSNITSVDIMPVANNYISSTSGIRLALWNPSSAESVSINSRFKSPVFCATYRRDGALLGVGTKTGQAIFFDAQTQKNKGPKNPIRTFQAHDDGVNSLSYDPSGHWFASASDGGSAKVFDLADTRTSSTPLWQCTGHSDQVRHCVFSEATQSVFATASYDHTVKLWDVRAKDKRSINERCLIELKHDDPVERVLLFPDDRIIATAAATIVKLWDLTSGGRLLHSFENHGKPVTSMCLGGNRTFLITAGLDQQICFTRIDSGDFSRVHKIKTSRPILSMALSPNDKYLAFGALNTLSIFCRKDTSQSLKRRRTSIVNEPFQSAKRESFTKAAFAITQQCETIAKARENESESYESSADELSPPRTKTIYSQAAGENEEDYCDSYSMRLEKIPLGQLDFLIRSRRYREMVSSMMAKHNLHEKRPELFVAAFQQLRIRQVLRQALAGHSADQLIPLFKFIRMHLFTEDFFDVLYDVANTVITIYADQQLSSGVFKAIEGLKKQISKELEAQKFMSRIAGSMDILIHQQPNS